MINHEMEGDVRWRQLADQEAVGEFLTPAEREFLADHRSDDPEVRLEQQLRASFGQLGDHRAPDSVDEAIVQNAVDLFFANPTRAENDGTAFERPQAIGGSIAATSSNLGDLDGDATGDNRSRRRRWWGGAGSMAACFALVAWWGIFGGEDLRLATQSPKETLAQQKASSPELQSAVDQAELESIRYRVLSGRAKYRGGALGVDSEIPDDEVELTVEDEFCVDDQHAGTRLCLGEGSRARLRGHDAFELLRGVAQVEVKAMPGTTSSLAQLSVSGKVFASEKGRYRVHRVANIADGFAVEVRDGELSIHHAGGEPVARVMAGESVRFGEHGAQADSTKPDVERSTKPRSRPRKSVRPAADWLEDAHAALRKKDYRGAAKAYETLIARAPDDEASRSAKIRLAQLYASELHQPRRALQVYRSYLKGPQGVLDEEARLGMIECYRRLGQSAKERAQIEAFLEMHASSGYADRLRLRLSELNL